MKKIYFLLLCCITLASASYGQDVTITQNDFDTNQNWTLSSVSPSTGIGSVPENWGILNNLTGAGTIGTTPGTQIQNQFFGLLNDTQELQQNFSILTSVVNITGFSNVVIKFDYEYIAHNAQRKPLVTYRLINGNTPIGTPTTIIQPGVGPSDEAATIEIPLDETLTTNYRLRINITYPEETNGNDDLSAFTFAIDNLRVISENSFDGYVLQDGTWTNPAGAPLVPDNTTGTYDALIVDGTYSINSAIQLQNVYTEAGASISIAPTGSLTVNDITTADNLLINSSSSSYGSLIVNGTVTGTAIYSRHINAFDNTSSTGNDLISSPLPGEDFFTFVQTNSNLQTLSEVQALFGPFNKSNGTYDQWTIADTGNTLDPGVGYRTASTDNGNFEFTGDIETLAISVPVYYISNQNASQWNLIGNPYTSYLDIDEFVLNTNNATLFQTGKAAVYGYDGLSGWVIYNASTDVKMTPGQGFYVAVPAGTTTNSSMLFTPSMRTHSTDDDFVAGRTTNLNKTHFELALKAGNEQKHYTSVYFNDIATLGLDEGYDATIYGNNYSGFTMFTQLVESNPNFKIGIQTLPNSNLATGIDIPLGIIAPKGQQITLEINESTLSESATVYLEDTKTNTWTLLSDKAYTFTTDEKLSGLGRFVIHTTDDSKLSIEDSTKDQIQIYTGERAIKLKGQLYRNTKLTIFDIQGRQVHNTVLNQTVNEYNINTTGLGSGIYIVRIENTNGNQISKRVILK